MTQRNLSKKEILVIIKYLQKRLPTRPTAVLGVYKSPKSIIKEVKKSKFPDKSIQKISDNIGYFLGILRSIKVKYIEQSKDGVWASIDGEIISDFDSLSSAGLYKVKGFDHSEIYLFRKKRYKIDHILGILAHEYAHHYLYLHNIRKEKEWANELMTDIAAIYLGLGKLLYQGSTPIIWTEDYKHYGFYTECTRNIINIGYITRSTIRRTIMLSAKLRSWEPSEVASAFYSPLYKILVYLYFKIYYRYHKINNEKEEISNDVVRKKCPFCSKNIDKLTLNCPFCGRIVKEKIY